MSLNGVANGNPKSKRRRGIPSIDSVDVEVLISPALQSQNGLTNGPTTPTRSRRKHGSSKSKSNGLGVDITAANINNNALSSNGGVRAHNGNGNAVVGAMKERVVDWEIPRKVLHSSIGTSPLPPPLPPINNP